MFDAAAVWQTYAKSRCAIDATKHQKPTSSMSSLYSPSTFVDYSYCAGMFFYRHAHLYSLLSHPPCCFTAAAFSISCKHMTGFMNMHWFLSSGLSLYKSACIDRNKSCIAPRSTISVSFRP